MVSLTVAYILCFFGGWFGLHHLYLRRPYHAFTWFATGACFGFGLFWDFCELSEYVQQCNTWSTKNRDASTKRYPAKCTMSRFIGQLVLGSWLGIVGMAAVPDEWWHQRYMSVVGTSFSAACVVWGVYIVGNIGLQKRPLHLTTLLITVAVNLSTLLLTENNGNGIVWSAIVASIALNHTATWRTDEKGLSRKIYFKHVFIYSLLWFLSVFNNARITFDGRLQPVRVVVVQMFEEFDAQVFFDEIRSIFEYLLQNSLSTIAADVLALLQNFLLIGTVADPHSIDEAYEILGLSRFSTKHQIRHECRKLMRKFHPDRNPAPSSQNDFIKVQSACHLLIHEL